MPCDLLDPFNETCTLLNDFLGNLPQYPTFLDDDGIGLLDTVVVSDGRLLLPFPISKPLLSLVIPLTH